MTVTFETGAAAPSISCPTADFYSATKTVTTVDGDMLTLTFPGISFVLCQALVAEPYTLSRSQVFIIRVGVGGLVL